MDAEQGALGTILGNVSEAVYDNTVSVAQLKSVTGKDLVRELQNYMASYQGTGDSSIDMGRAMQMLKMSRKGYLTESARRKKDLEKEKEKISANMEYIRREIRELDEKRDRITQQQNGMNMGTRDKSTEDLLELRIDRVKRRRELNGAFLAVVLLCRYCRNRLPGSFFRTDYFKSPCRCGNSGSYSGSFVFPCTAEPGTE